MTDTTAEHEPPRDRTFGPRTLEMVAERFRVLGESTRLRILDALRDGEKTVTALVERVETTQANVSGHLAVLRRHGMVRRRKEGVRAYYAIDDPLVFRLCELVCDGLADDLDDRREALRGSG
jgi:ArsR family transcriptional regulator